MRRLSLVLAGWLFTGCATVDKAPQISLNEELGLPSDTVLTIGVLPPDITLRELAAGGTSQERDDWSQTARDTSRDLIKTIRPENFTYFVDLEVPDQINEEIREVKALYRMIDLTLWTRSIGLTGPPTSTNLQFGSVDEIAELVGADALMLVYGVDDIFTTDRKALAALGIIASGITGVAVMPSSGEAHLSAILVAPDGRILWHNRIGQDKISDLRKTDGVQRTLRTLLKTMPKSGPL